MGRVLAISPADRVYARSVEQGDCIVWTGAIYGNGGYGCIRVDGKVRPAHRVTWEAENGPVPDGLELDHTCETRVCVRPSHLEAVTHEENLRRSRERGRHKPARKIGDDCGNGHILTEGNTSLVRGRFLRCLACHREGMRTRRAS